MVSWIAGASKLTSLRAGLTYFPVRTLHESGRLDASCSICKAMDYKFVILANVGLIDQNKVPLNTMIDLEFFRAE